MRFLGKTFLLILVILTSVNCYAQRIKGIEFFGRNTNGFFSGVQVKVKDGKEIVHFSAKLFGQEVLLKDIEQMHGKIVEVLWQGELETELRDGHVRVLQITEAPVPAGRNLELFKNSSVENIYNYFLDHEETKAMVSIKPELTKYDKNVQYKPLGASSFKIKGFQEEFSSIVKGLHILINQQRYAPETIKEELVDRLKDNVSIFLDKHEKDYLRFNILTGLSDLEINVLFPSLYSFAINPNRLTSDEWLSLDLVLFSCEDIINDPESPECCELILEVKDKGLSLDTRRTETEKGPSLADNVHRMKAMIEQNVRRSGMTMARIIKIDPDLFSDENIIYLLDRAKDASSKEEEMVLMESIHSLIDAKEATGLSIGDELKNKYIDVVEYLDGEKDMFTVAHLEKELNFSDADDAITKLLNKGGELDEKMAKLLFGTAERNFEDSLCSYVEKYNTDINVRNRFFVLVLLVMANKAEVKIDGKPFDVPTRIVEMMKKNSEFYKEFKLFNIQEEVRKANVRLDIEDAMRQERERIRMKVNAERDRFK